MTDADRDGDFDVDVHAVLDMVMLGEAVIEGETD